MKIVNAVFFGGIALVLGTALYMGTSCHPQLMVVPRQGEEKDVLKFCYINVLYIKHKYHQDTFKVAVDPDGKPLRCQ